MTKTIGAAALVLVLVLTGWTAGAEEAKADRHEGYYYPKVTTSEEYQARAVTMPDSDRSRRLAFVTAVTNELLTKPSPPQFVMFAKGDYAEKMIIVAVGDGAFDTLYRARALLAELSAVARLSPVFREYQVEDIFTYFDLLKLLGFERLTISDGKTFAHQVNIK